ncbi:lysophospholipid acyltransferase 2-like isoform X2 [Physella acuta]|uniref:lysophospholipid acyltransferase 2-like isoform X2 n=1 Tax=Physella acuta TaxID=109671 RepID=UPI0027DDC4FB|nr:lysophospholipid acyltransferase 2-like isoform X2 [Physella acuta]XP_059166203.1 lysophospholipid acyltransferase 2-like isoform X2 [Physella acuta]
MVVQHYSPLWQLLRDYQLTSLFSPEKVGANTRHVVETLVGVILTVFCFGMQIWHLMAQSLVSYVFLAYGGKKHSHTFVFLFSMLYLSICHIYRQVYDYGGYTLDITGPLMIQTQKLTSLAFALHDGRFKDQAVLSNDQKEQAVKKLPNLLQFLSYMFYFHGIMVGPLTFYNDYLAFIDGSSFSKPVNSNECGTLKHPATDLNKLVLKKLIITTACGMGMIILPSICFPPEIINTPEYYNMTFLSRMLYVLGVMTIAKHKYYFAWKLADAVNNAAGFGFSAYDSLGNPKWDLTDNVDIRGVELSTSLKINIESWNKKTTIWLRRVVYDRAPFANTLAVFACSAFWHGFYPGYYVTFGTGALMTVAARQVRRHIRPWFQQSQTHIFVYEAITFIATRLANCYICFPFLVLEFYACFNMYRSLYFYYHIATSLSFLFFSFSLDLNKKGIIKRNDSTNYINKPNHVISSKSTSLTESKQSNSSIGSDVKSE